MVYTAVVSVAELKSDRLRERAMDKREEEEARRLREEAHDRRPAG